MPKERLSSYNFFVTLVLAVVVLGYLIFAGGRSVDTPPGQTTVPERLSDSVKPSTDNRATEKGNPLPAAQAVRQTADQHSFSSASAPAIPADLPADMVRALTSPPPPLPPDLEAQLNAPPPELPEDLKRQLMAPPPPLPPDMQAQLNAPAPSLPEDIKRALATPPRIVSIDEVNKPKSPGASSSAADEAETTPEPESETDND